MAPVVPAALNVWHPPQPVDAKTFLPAAASPSAVGWVATVPSIVWGSGETVPSPPQPAASTTSPPKISTSRRTAASVPRRLPPAPENETGEGTGGGDVGGRVVDDERDGEPDEQRVERRRAGELEGEPDEDGQRDRDDHSDVPDGEPVGGEMQAMPDVAEP